MNRADRVVTVATVAAGEPQRPGTTAEVRRGSDAAVARTTALAVLVLVATVYGLTVHDAYRDVTALTRATWRAQDVVCLACAPLLLWSAHRARHGHLRAHLAGVGLSTWLAYCYAHLCFGAPFNAVFPVYVAILLLAGFGMLDGQLRLDVAAARPAFERTPRRATAWFLLVAGCGVAGLWLSDIVPGLVGGLPAGVHLAELPNPTWVLDLAWIVPLAIGAARLLLRDHPGGPPVAAGLLVMLLVLSVSMLTITPFALADGLGRDSAVRPQLVVFSAVFAVLGTVETVLLVLAAVRCAPPDRPWLRPGWWPGT